MKTMASVADYSSSEVPEKASQLRGQQRHVRASRAAIKSVMMPFQAMIATCAVLLCTTAAAQDKPQSEPLTGDLQVVVVGFQSATGDVKIALSNSETNYTDPSQAFRGTSAAIEGDTATAIFANIPYGEYAVRVYHDANDNGKLDTNVLGIPKESYGFSNNARGTVGPATWEHAKFVLRGRRLTVEIRVK